METFKYLKIYTTNKPINTQSTTKVKYLNMNILQLN